MKGLSSDLPPFQAVPAQQIFWLWQIHQSSISTSRGEIICTPVPPQPRRRLSTRSLSSVALWTEHFLQAPHTPKASLQAPSTRQVVSKVKFLSNQRSQFTSRHTLQLPFMSLPSCSSKQPLLVVLYFGGAHLAATFGISPQNCPRLIPHVNLLAVCRSSKQQHFCAAQKHFRTSAGHCGESCIPTTGP